MDVLERFASPEFRADPHPYLHQLRRSDPVHRTSAGYYLLSRHTDAWWTLRNTGTVFRAPDRDQLARQYPQALRHRAVAVQLESIAGKNPPEHTRLRRLVNRDLTAGRIAGLTDRIVALCDRLLDEIEQPLRDGVEVDLHHALSLPLTLQVFGDLLGVPEDDREMLSSTAIAVMTSFGSPSEEALRVADEQTDRIAAYFDDLVGRRRRAPCHDLVSALARVRDEDPDRLDDAELTSMLWILWLSGRD